MDNKIKIETPFDASDFNWVISPHLSSATLTISADQFRESHAAAMNDVFKNANVNLFTDSDGNWDICLFLGPYTDERGAISIPFASFLAGVNDGDGEDEEIRRLISTLRREADRLENALGR